MKTYNFFIIAPNGEMRNTAIISGEETFQQVYKLDLNAYFTKYKMNVMQRYPGSSAGYMITEQRD